VLALAAQKWPSPHASDDAHASGGLKLFVPGVGAGMVVVPFGANMVVPFGATLVVVPFGANMVVPFGANMVVVP
jgi:hypothetical protein